MTTFFEETKLSADSGFHTEENMKTLFTGEIDAYIADDQFRKRAPRFVGADRYKERHWQEQAKRTGKNRLFSTADFVFQEDLSHCICPAVANGYIAAAAS